MRLEGGAALASWGEVRLGLLRGGTDVIKKVGEESVTAPGFSNAGGLTARFTYDQLDQRLFATRGTLASATMYSSRTGLGADQSFRTVEGRWATVFSSGRNVWTVGLRGGTDLSSNAPFTDQFKVGGLFNFSGYRPQQLVGREYALGTMQFRRRVGDLSRVFGTGIYAGASLEAGNVYQRLDGTPTRGALISSALFLGIDSKLGPVYVGYGMSEGGRTSLYLYLGSSLDAF
jgi:NTE family protein